ncbi:hypothetical protein SAVIM40S_08303 [Streptomyces avidinii]
MDPRRLRRRRRHRGEPGAQRVRGLAARPASGAARGLGDRAGRTGGAEGRRRGDLRRRGRGAQQPRERGRPGHDRLHLGHHRPPQGLRADPPQLLRRVRQRGGAPEPALPHRRVLRAALPAGGARLRAPGGGGGRTGADPAGLRTGHQEPDGRAPVLPSHPDPRRPARLREGLQLGARQGPGRRQGQDLRRRRGHGDRLQPAPWTPRPARPLGLQPQAQGSSPSSSTASCTRSSAAAASTPSPAAPRWASGSATSSAASASRSWRATASPSPARPRPSTRWDQPEDRHGAASRCPAPWCASRTTARCCCTASTSSRSTGRTRPRPPRR